MIFDEKYFMYKNMTADSSMISPPDKTLKPARDKGSLTAKGRATRAAILDAAHEVFKKKGFFGASISEIVRSCGVSMATFYQYFKNKEQAFQELNDRIISRFMEQTDAISMEGLTFKQRLMCNIEILYDHTQNNLAFNRILGESELIDQVTNAYYESIARHLRLFLRHEVQLGNIRSLDPNIVAYGLIGICYFHSLDWKTPQHDLPRDQLLNLIADFMMNGISGSAPWKRGADWHLLSIPDPVALRQENEEQLTKGKKTRLAIFNAAEEVIGEYGFNRASISEITRAAKVAQGTFYVHFESKFDLIKGFVTYFNRMMRRNVQRVVARTTDRRDAERVGILAFIDFTRLHRKIYRIIPECEVISRDVSIWYYSKIARGYFKGLKQGIKRGEIRDLPVELLAHTIMGMVHFIVLKWIIWNTSPQSDISDQLRTDILEFLFFGLKPEQK